MTTLSVFKLLSRGIIAALFVAASVTIQFALPSHAAPIPAQAQVSFTFDDGAASAYTLAAPALKKYGLTGTDYVTTGCIGMTTIPNTCRADQDVKYMTWAQVKALQSTYGWEIGSHTITHPYLATYDASDGQPKALTQTQVVQEISGSKAALAAQGINATSFASPYGDYNLFSLQTIAKYYTNHRGFADQGNNVWPYNDVVLQNYPVQNPVTVAQVKAKIDAAIAGKQWLVLTFHDIATVASTKPDDYQWSVANLEAVAAYVQTKQKAGLIKSVNASNGSITSTTNLLPNGGFANGIAQGWHTDNAASFKADSATNGSFPEPQKSILVSSSSTQSHLFSPRVAVDPSIQYVLKSFLNVKAMKAGGEIGFYIDEFDANGNWVSGQYKGRETGVWVDSMNYGYTPSSARVKTASIQIYITPNSGVSAYLDTVQLFPVTTATPQSNLMPNATFDTGISGWTTDNAKNVTYDMAAKNVTFNTSGATAHLFSPRIAVTAGKSYYLENSLSLTTNSGGGVGFYLDEYDAAGNWISGQYKLWTGTIASGDITFTYTPSSSSVAVTSLQLIFDGGNGLKGTFDNSRFYAL